MEGLESAATEAAIPSTVTGGRQQILMDELTTTPSSVTFPESALAAVIQNDSFYFEEVRRGERQQTLTFPLKSAMKQERRTERETVQM